MTNHKSYQSDVDPIHFLNVLFITIVLYLHHDRYTNNYFTLLSHYQFNVILQKFAVGGFFFFSGFKLAISNCSTPGKIFWMKRFFRIYILYIFALLLAIFTYYPYFNNGDFPDLKNIIIHVFLLQSVFPNVFGPTVSTIWFVSVLLFCYLFFIFVRNYISNIKIMTILSIVTFTVISTIHLTTVNREIHVFTRDFSIYLMFFSLGMIHSKQTLIRMTQKSLLSLSLIFSLLLLFMYNLIYVNTFYEYIAYSVLVVLGNVFLYVVIFDAIKKTNNFNINNLFISKYSYASFCVFLFHRSIWCIMATIYPKGTLTQWFFIIIIGVPVIIIISFFVQKSYDRLTNRAQQIVSLGLAETRR